MAEAAPNTPKAAERILSAAERLFLRQGSRAVGVDEIVIKAGTTKPSLYRAFGSKDGLIAACVEQQAAELWSRFDGAVRAHPDDSRLQILTYIEALADRALDPGYRGCFLTTVTMEYPDAKHPAHRAALAHKTALRERLRDAARAMNARKPKRLADSLLLLIEGVSASSHVFGREGPAGAAKAAADALIASHLRET